MPAQVNEYQHKKEDMFGDLKVQTSRIQWGSTCIHGGFATHPGGILEHYAAAYSISCINTAADEPQTEKWSGDWVSEDDNQPQ